MKTAVLRFSITIFRGISLLALVYAFFLPWPTSFGQSGYGYGNNLGYGSDQSNFDLTGLWQDEDTQSTFFVVQAGNEVAMLEYWTDAATPGVGYAALSYGLIQSGENSDQIGTLLSAPTSNNGLRWKARFSRSITTRSFCAWILARTPTGKALESTRAAM